MKLDKLLTPMSAISTFIGRNWKQLVWMCLGLLFIVQLSSVKKEMRRIAFSLNANSIFTMEELERQDKDLEKQGKQTVSSSLLEHQEDYRSNGLPEYKVNKL